MSRPTRALPAATVVAAAAVLVVTAAPATAAPRASSTPAATVVTADGVRVPTTAAKADASNVAGWSATLTTSTRHISTVTIKVPSVVCPARATDPLFLGTVLTGQASATDTAFDYAGGDVVVTCTGGVPSYAAVVTRNPVRRSGTVSPGDVVEVKTVATKRSTKVTMTDTTSGGVVSVSGDGFQALRIEASGQGGYGTGRFPRPTTTMRFTSVSADSAPRGVLEPTRFDQVTALGATVLQTSALADRRAFGVTFVAQP